MMRTIQLITTSILVLIISSCIINCGADKYKRTCNCKWQENDGFIPRKRDLLIYGKARRLTLYYGARAPNRAAAAMLLLIMKDIIGYDNIHIEAGNMTLCELAGSNKKLRFNDTDYDETIIKSRSLLKPSWKGMDVLEKRSRLENPSKIRAANTIFRLIVHLAAEWTALDRHTCPALKKCDEQRDNCGAAGPRFYESAVQDPRSRMIKYILQTMGSPMAPMTLILQAKLSEKAWSKPVCNGTRSWSFYSNPRNLQQCDFTNNLTEYITPSDECENCYPVFVQEDYSNNTKTANDLSLRIKSIGLPLQIIILTESALRNLITDTESSILFLDYDLWTEQNQNRVRLVQPPPCIENYCHHEFEKIEAITVGDAALLHSHAPLLFDIITIFWLPPQKILQILQAEAKGKHVIEAACDQICNDSKSFKDWGGQLMEENIWIYVLLCDDPDFEEYKKVLDVFIRYQNHSKVEFEIENAVRGINCSDLYYFNKKLTTMSVDRRYERMAGIVGAGSGAAAAASHAEMMETQLVIYDTPPKNTELNPAARTVASNLISLVKVTQHFIQTRGWKRVAVISDNAQISKDFLNLLRQSNPSLGTKTLEIANKEYVTDILREFDHEKARIFMINVDAETASLIMCSVVELGLYTSDYVWMVRDWRRRSCDLGHLKYYTISYWWRGGEFPPLPGIHGNAIVRKWLDEQWPDRPWPRLAAPLFDSLLLLATATTATIQRNISLRYDLHGYGASRQMTESLDKENIFGVVQELNQKNYMVEAPLVFIDEWQNSSRVPLAVWRINSTTMGIKELKTLKQISLTEKDGAVSCWFVGPGDDFYGKCKDWPVVVGLFMIAIIPLVAYSARRWRLAQLDRRDREIHVRLLARCERTAAALADHLVDRSALVINNEIGKGHFGRVRLGMLKLSHRAVVAVAVKELRNTAVPAEEAEFLREACALVALSHAHIVRLIGVCAVDGPPLLLMEHAFFEDLLKYLRERKHLLEDNTMVQDMDKVVETEAAYLSAEGLTRLAREAAAALEYLATMRFVHRDVRAANCVVTAQRTLKLADFGMARLTGSTKEGVLGQPEDDDYKYICHRKGVFPVIWMAPESLCYGVFSSASDVWSLGVLMLEIATLGARPYGTWRPHVVYDYVREGGHPPFPRDASYHTIKILEMCWRLSPDARPTPTSIKEYLLQTPNALHPALVPALPEDNDDKYDYGDSGFKERDGNLYGDLDAHNSMF